MKPVRVIVVYATKFSHRFFLLKKNVYPGKQTASLSVKPAFFSVFMFSFFIFEKISLLILNCTDCKPLLLLKIKAKQNPVCQNNKYNAIFKHIHQNIRVYLESKKKCVLINDWEIL